MARTRLRTFEARIFVAILLVALVPAVLALAGGTLTLRSVGTTSGTLGAWDSVAESGRVLMESLEAAGVDDPAVAEAARRHREALSESVRLSRLYAFIAGRFVGALPLLAIIGTVLIAGLAWITARRLARAFAGPVTDLVEWTHRIARDQPLPAESRVDQEAVEEVRQVRTALRSMADELGDARRREVEAARLRSWTDLARRVAHELKNPLTPIKMAAASLTGGEAQRSDDAARVLVEEVDRLDALARTFAQYGRMPEGPQSDVDLAELLQGIVERHEHADVEISLAVRGPAVVRGHLDALRRVFENLVVNALEAQEGAEHAVVVLSVVKSADRIDVTVADHGPGVPEDLVREIWNPDVTTKRSGTGLGLAIVRQIVTLHGGGVAVRERNGGGAVFRVTFPLHAPTSE